MPAHSPKSQGSPLPKPRSGDSSSRTCCSRPTGLFSPLRFTRPNSLRLNPETRLREKKEMRSFVIIGTVQEVLDPNGHPPTMQPEGSSNNTSRYTHPVTHKLGQAARHYDQTERLYCQKPLYQEPSSWREPSRAKKPTSSAPIR